MAENISNTQLLADDISKILYVHVRSSKVGKDSNELPQYRGYRFDYLFQNLTMMEMNFMSCVKCSGLIRDACSSHGETVCFPCRMSQHHANPVIKVRNSVANLLIKCPLLRDCGWTGILIDSVKHLKECRVFLVECSLECGAVIKRCELENHINNHCPHRLVSCLFCEEIRPHKFIPRHLTVCHAYPVKCLCGLEIRRGLISLHIETECPQIEIECPYAKYSCNIGAILRKDLLAHKREFFIEHQDMIEQENCKLKEELYQLKDKHNNLEGRCNDLEKRESDLKQECYLMKQSLMLKRQLYGVVISVIPRQSPSKKQEFYVGCYRFDCIVTVVDSIKIILRRLTTDFGNDRNVIYITFCVVCLERTGVLKEPFSTNKQLFLKSDIGKANAIMEIKYSTFSRHIQPDGTLNIGVYFDYDYVTYTGVFF
ncbi:TNF receptor-associated factor 4 [Oopsacas minuta]|uniref:TNF receptor-associated factor 4 n=1 Tax=Oopsacas minuta TaxID=111878 RepID=A0AAV7KCK6_9METZ|nr:TNF receptor-associated factor 4 [Oopsacas minuta]